MTEREDTRLVDYLYGELSEEEAKAFGAEPARAEQAEELGQVLQTMRTLEDEAPPAHLDALILAHARESAEANANQGLVARLRKLFASPLAGLVAAGSLAAVLAVIALPVAMRPSALEPAYAPESAAPRSQVVAAPGAPAPADAPRPLIEAPAGETEKLAFGDGAPPAAQPEPEPSKPDPATGALAKAELHAAAKDEEARAGAAGAKAGRLGGARLEGQAAFGGGAVGGEGASLDIGGASGKGAGLGSIASNAGPSPARSAPAPKRKADDAKPAEELAEAEAPDDVVADKKRMRAVSVEDVPKEREGKKNLATKEQDALAGARDLDGAPAPPPPPPRPAPVAAPRVDAMRGVVAQAPAQEKVAESAASARRPTAATVPAPGADDSERLDREGNAEGIEARAVRDADRLIQAGELARARALLEAARARTVGTVAHARLSVRLGRLELRRERWDQAIAYANDGLRSEDQRVRADALAVAQAAEHGRLAQAARRAKGAASEPATTASEPATTEQAR